MRERHATLICLAILLGLALGPAAAHAEGIIVETRPAAEGGWQRSLTAVSPAPPPSPLSGRLPAGGPLTRLQLWPWPPVQGQTLTAWLNLSRPISLTAAFDGKRIPVVLDGGQGWLLAPVDPLARAGTHPLLLSGQGLSLTLPVAVAAGTFPTDNVPASTTDPILSQASRVAAEAQRVAGLFGAINAGAWSPAARFAPPLDGAYPHTSPFGSRRTYGNATTQSVHVGEDYAAAPGTAVRAPAAGRVMLAETLFVRGNAVILDHGHGVYTGFWHMQSLAVKAGDTVRAGQTLGGVGSTGLSTGAHLHWEMQIVGVPVDPRQWLAQGSID